MLSLLNIYAFLLKKASFYLKNQSQKQTNVNISAFTMSKN